MNQQTPLIRWFSDLDRSDTATVGGKNSSLGEMIGKLKEVGIDVPDGFATTADAYWKFLEANDLTDRLADKLAELKSDGSNLAQIGKAIRKMILQADLPDPLAQAITRGLRDMAERSGHKITSVAVRSSATAEDLPEASFAGQLESFLNVRGEKALLEDVPALLCVAVHGPGHYLSHQQRLRSHEGGAVGRGAGDGALRQAHSFRTV